MDKKEFSEFLKKCFGKNKDTKYHAVAMLAIYSFFMLILVIVIRIGGSSINMDDTKTNNNENIEINQKVDNKNDNNSLKNEEIINNNNIINYSYSYTITFDNNTEVYLGKKVGNKEKFTLIKDGISYEYAILNDNFLILENGIYHLTDKLDNYFKYCNLGIISKIIEKEIPLIQDNIRVYNINNQIIANAFNQNISELDNYNNEIELILKDGKIEKIKLDLSNYISVILGNIHDLTINMEFANIGTTDDFEINVS